MGFIVCTVEPLEGGEVRVRRIRRINVTGPQGLFALHFPKLANADDGSWSLSAQAFLRLAEPAAGPQTKIMFDLTPYDPERFDLYEFLDASGRTGEDATDVLFHFRIACTNVRRAKAPHGLDDLTLPAWDAGAALYEQLRLDGGLSGGKWSWNKIDQNLKAAVFGSPGKT
jgi:hypothetical protein